MLCRTQWHALAGLIAEYGAVALQEAQQERADGWPEYSG